MSDATTRAVTDAPVTDAASQDVAPPSPFTIVTVDPAAMVCEGDVCDIPSPGVE